MPGPLELVALGLAAVAAFALLEAMIRRTMVGVGVVLTAAAIGTTFPELPNASFGGTTVTLMDVLATVLLGGAIARWLRRPPVSLPQWLLIAFSILALFSVIQGIGDYGFHTAINEFRRYFWFISVALYFSTVKLDGSLLDRIARTWMILALVLVGLAILRWGVLAAGLTGGYYGVLGAGGFRVLGSAPTLVIMQGFIFGALAWARGDAPAWIRRLTPVFLATVVLMQHRSVWAGLLVTVTLIVLMERRVAHRLLPIMLLAVVLVGAFSLIVLDDQAADLPGELAESAAYRGTWEWRVDGWYVLIAEGPEGTEVLTGQPFGGGWERDMDGRSVSFHPHNFYVETYLRTGLAGLGLLAGLYAVLLWRLRAIAQPHGSPYPTALLFLLVSHLVHFIPYAPYPEQGLILGLAICAASAQPSRDRDPPREKASA